MSKSRERQERATRRRNLARSAILAWDSYRSHLADAVKCKDLGANSRWHARCCQDYAEIIYSASVELHELTKLDFAERVEPRQDPI